MGLAKKINDRRIKSANKKIEKGAKMQKEGEASYSQGRVFKIADGKDMQAKGKKKLEKAMAKDEKLNPKPKTRAVVKKSPPPKPERTNIDHAEVIRRNKLPKNNK